MKQKKIVTKGFCILAMSLCLVLGMSAAAWADTGQDAYQDWTSENSLPDTAGNYALTQDVTLENAWIAPSGTTKIQLNGHKITTAPEATDGIVIAAATVEIYDTQGNKGEIVGNNNKNYSKAFTVQYGGKLEMFGGNLTGGAEDGSMVNAVGGDVIIHAPVTVTGKKMYHCAFRISNDSSGNKGNVTLDEGVVVTSNYPNATGANVTGGTLTTGADFDTSRSSINVGGGDVIVTGGKIKNSQGIQAAIFVSSGTLEVLDGEILGGNGIDVDHRNQPGTVNIRGGVFKGASTSVKGHQYNTSRTKLHGGYYKSMPVDYSLGNRCELQTYTDQTDWLYTDCPYRVFKYPHQHSFGYSADSATLTATCTEEECTLPESKVEMKIVAPERTSVDDTSKSAEASLDGRDDFVAATGLSVSEADIMYVGRGNTTYAESGDAPETDGTFTAKITVEGQTASVDYEIAKSEKPEPPVPGDKGKDTPKKPEKKTPEKNASEKPVKKATSNVIMAKMAAKGKKALKITWTKAPGASGYDVFFTYCGKQKHTSPKLVKTITGRDAVSWTKKKLRKKTAYKAYVKAFVVKNGKKAYIAKSPTVHAYTSGSTKNYTNPKSVTVNKSSVSMSKGNTFKVKAKVKKLKKGKKLISKKHAPKLRYMSTDNSVASVSASGVITAKGTGDCTIYVFAVNGIGKTVTVRVR